MGLDVYFWKAKRHPEIKNIKERVNYELNNCPSTEDIYFRKNWTVVSYMSVQNCEYVRIEKYRIDNFCEDLYKAKEILTKLGPPEGACPLDILEINRAFENLGDWIAAESMMDEVKKLLDIFLPYSKYTNYSKIDWDTETLYMEADW